MEIKSQLTAMPDYDAMIKAGMHFVRKKTIFHPNMKAFVYTTRENIYILDLVKTSEQLKQVIEYLSGLVTEGKTILFVGTTRQSADVVKEVADALSMPYINHRWLGGTLTNFKVIMSRVKHLMDLEAEQASGGFDKYTKKERVLKEREIATLREKYEGLKRLTKKPEAVFVTSLKEGQLPVKEARMAKIPVIGITNTDSNPALLDFPIPANDNSRKSVELILRAIGESLQPLQTAQTATQ